MVFIEKGYTSINSILYLNYCFDIPNNLISFTWNWRLFQNELVDYVEALQKTVIGKKS